MRYIISISQGSGKNEPTVKLRISILWGKYVAGALASFFPHLYGCHVIGRNRNSYDKQKLTVHEEFDRGCNQQTVYSVYVSMCGCFFPIPMRRSQE